MQEGVKYRPRALAYRGAGRYWHGLQEPDTAQGLHAAAAQGLQAAAAQGLQAVVVAAHWACTAVGKEAAIENPAIPAAANILCKIVAAMTPLLRIKRKSSSSPKDELCFSPSSRPLAVRTYALTFLG